MTRYVTPEEYAERSGLTPALVRRMARDGRLPRADTRRVLIPEDAEPVTRVYDAGRERVDARGIDATLRNVHHVAP